MFDALLLAADLAATYEFAPTADESLLDEGEGLAVAAAVSSVACSFSISWVWNDLYIYTSLLMAHGRASSSYR